MSKVTKPVKHPKGLSVVDPAYRAMVKRTKDITAELKAKYRS